MNDATNTIGAEDYFRMEVSTDGGFELGSRPQLLRIGSWRTESIDIGSEFGNTSQLRIRFAAAENDPGTCSNVLSTRSRSWCPANARRPAWQTPTATAS